LRHIRSTVPSSRTSLALAPVALNTARMMRAVSSVVNRALIPFPSVRATLRRDAPQQNLRRTLVLDVRRNAHAQSRLLAKVPEASSIGALLESRIQTSPGGLCVPIDFSAAQLCRFWILTSGFGSRGFRPPTPNRRTPRRIAKLSCGSPRGGHACFREVRNVCIAWRPVRPGS
jgi:hypothetical protein